MMNRCRYPNSSPTDRPRSAVVSADVSGLLFGRPAMMPSSADRAISRRRPRALTAATILRMRSAGLIAAMLVLGATAPQAAFAADCVARPSLQAGEAGHWRYRIDRPSHRKCWYVEGEPSAVEPSTAGSRPAGTETTSLASFFSSLVPAWQSVASIRRQPDPDAAATTPAPSIDTAAPRRGASASHRRALNASRAAKLAQAHQFHAERVERADQQHQLDPSQREDLFEEFLHWSTLRP